MFPLGPCPTKITSPLGFDKSELFSIAGFLSVRRHAAESQPEHNIGRPLDLYVAAVLSQEPTEVQRTALATLSIPKSMTKGTAQ